MSRKEERDRAIAETLEKVRAVEGVTRQSLATIRDHMIALAQRRELFPEEDFPLPADGTGEVFDVLSRDEDGRHELYVEVANKHVWTPPHNHTTWAVVVGIQGVELNRIWEGDGGPAGEAPLRLAREVEVRSGAGVCLMPNDFHSIHMEEGCTTCTFISTDWDLPISRGGSCSIRKPAHIAVSTETIVRASIDSTELRERIIAGGEFALIDVRESGSFSHGHVLTACNLPLSRLELDAVTLLPRKAAFVVLTDGGDGLAGRAAGVLQTMGYGDVAVHEGGIEAWRSAGGEVFEGINVPSKAFGECVESACATPALDAAEVHRRIAAGDDIIILDGRPFGEYSDFAIPGAFSCPNSELPRHIADLAPSPSTTVVVNCAGRTRSIIGAQTLRNTGLANPVHALENGTIGWEWPAIP